MRGNTRTALRLGAYVASGALALSGAVLAVTPAEAVTYDPAPANQAATWLEGELSGNVVHNEQYDFDDIALTADVAYALDALGGHGTTVGDIVDTIEPRAHDEWYTSTFQAVTTTYGGSIAKLLVLVQQTGGTPTSYGGNNLVTLLEGQVAAAAPIAGRVQNTNDSFGDANTLGQAYTAHALDTAGSAKADAARDFLLKQQCASGYFRLYFNTDKTAANQSCVEGTSPADPDATAVAVLQLASQTGDQEVAAAVAKAKSWLINQQRCDGSFGGGTSTSGSNANSTGVIAWALGDSPASRQAAQWLVAHQVPQNEGAPLAGDRGAIAYTDAGLAAGRANGITATAQDEWRRAASQAVPGIRWYSTDPTPAIALTAPTGYFKQGSRVAVRTTGAAAGTVLCVAGTGTPIKGIATASGLSTVVTLPAGTRTRVYTVKDPFGHSATAPVKVLGAKTLSVTRSPGRVKRSRTVTVAVRGLAPGETARIFYGNTLVKSGAASTSGNLVARFGSGRSLGKKTVRAYGRFADIRKGATTLKVVR